MLRRSLAVLAALVVPAAALAVSFPDVTPHHLYREQIETLAARGIVKGNPDGSFNPGGSINRAELLTLLYRATGKTPVTPTKACFKDVDVNAWYAAVVCDAAKSGYVGGYPDGYFRAGNPVNRVESLKMIHTVLQLKLDASASTTPLKAFRDVSLDAWYSSYMASAFAYKILPIAGQGGDRFMPEAALTRGEAAAYIFNGLGLTVQGSSSSASSAMSSAVTRGEASSRDASNDPILLDVDFPFSDDGSFSKKTSKVYVFSMKATTTGNIEISVPTEQTVQCRLYKIDSVTSFAMEYYIGQQIENKCWMRVSFGAGDYQLEVVPSESNGTFVLASKLGNGDGNDGFVDAAKLLKGSPKTGYLEAEDFGEFYTFTLTAKKKMTVTVSNDDETNCLIYPMADVDLFGFSGPVCDEEYEYPAGTYYVGVTRRDQRDGKISFTIRYE